MKKFEETIRNLITRQEGQPPKEMILRQTIEDANEVRRFVPSSVKVEWVSRQTDANGIPRLVRRTQETKTEFRVQTGFTAAGKTYKSIAQLALSKGGDDHLCVDIYGREVLCFRERFPCFDSYDYLYENRYYRWFYLRNGDMVTLIYSEDEMPVIRVTEDVQQIPTKWWKEIQTYWG